LRPYHAHKLDFHSSLCVFLGYSSSHLGYCCPDLACQHIYVSRHVRFHEDVFPFANSKQIAQQPFTSSQYTHLPTLNPSLNVHPTTPPIHQTSSSHQRSTKTLQIHHLPTMFATNPSPPSPTPLSPYACFSKDHYARISSPFLELHASCSTTA